MASPLVSRKDSIYLDLLFLIQKFLSSSSCTSSGEALRKEVESLNIVPDRIDWQGNAHKQTYAEWIKRHEGIKDDHLLSLFKNLSIFIGKNLPPSLSNSLISPLNLGRYALHDKETAKQVTWTSRQYSATIQQRATYPPHNFKPSNWAKSIMGRQLVGKQTNQLICPVHVYEQIQLGLRTLGHLSSVYCVLFDRTGSKVFTGSDDCLIKLWCVWSGRLLCTLRGHQSEICDMDVSYDNTLLASASCDKVIRVWDLQTGASVAVLHSHTAILTSIEFSPLVDDEVGFLVTTGRDGNVCFWLWDKVNNVFESTPTKFQERSRPGGSVLCVSWSSGGRFVAAGASDASIHIYYIPPVCNQPNKIAELFNHKDKVDSIRFAHTKLQFTSGSYDGNARIWKYEDNRWVAISLNVALTLGETGPDIQPIAFNTSAKLMRADVRVIMVAWNCHDTYVITSLTNYEIKVWNAMDGKLTSILKGHEDEAYCLECHPTDPRVLLSAAHDGNIFLWNIETGQQISKFHNLLEHQGHGAVFDAKFSPTGNHIACTDSHGHLLIFSYGDNTAYKKVPLEQFFHTDYRPLIHDSFGAVLDEQTQQAPHRMPPPFLVDIDGNPHPLSYQRLVPGREHLISNAFEPIVPYGDIPVSPPPPTSPIFPGIEGFNEAEQLPQAQGPETGVMGNGVVLSSPRNAPIGLRREGEVAGVRQMHSNAPRSQMASADDLQALRRRHVIPPLSPSTQRNSRRIRKANGDLEIAAYRSEKRRTKRAKSTDVWKSTVSEMASRMEDRSTIMSRLALRVRQVGSTSENTTQEEIVVSSSESSSPSTSSMSSNSEEEGGWEEERRRPQTRIYSTRSHRSSRHTVVVDSDEETVPPTGLTNGHLSNEDSDINNSPDIRTSNRRRIRNRRFVSAASWLPSDEEEEEIVVDSTEKPGASKSPQKRKKKTSKLLKSVPRYPVASTSLPFPTTPGQLPPDLYLPPPWVLEEYPKPSPYLPQIGDQVVYLRQGHELYVEEVMSKLLWTIGDNKQVCYNSMTLQPVEYCEVLEVDYETGPPTLCFLKLQTSGENEDSRTFTLRYHDLPCVVDFLILKEKFDASLAVEWEIGDRFRSIIDDKWWYGKITAIEPFNENEPNSPFQAMCVVWDTQETERLSCWDVEEVGSREDLECGLSIDNEEMMALFRHQVSENQWWNLTGESAAQGFEKVEEEIERLCGGIEKLLTYDIFSPFSGPVDLRIYQAYTLAVAFPTDLKLILKKLRNRFYRRSVALKWEIEMMKRNALSFNQPRSDIVRKAKLLCELLMYFTDHQDHEDIERVMEIVDVRRRCDESEDTSDQEERDEPCHSGHNSTSFLAPWISEEEAEELPSLDDWKRECVDLVEFVWETEDAGPFREHVDEDDYPDYMEYVDEMMDLSIVKEKLATDKYLNPNEVDRDLSLIFNNSKLYNTNKKSKIYSMTVRLQILVHSRMQPIIEKWRKVVDAHARAEQQKDKRAIANRRKKKKIQRQTRSSKRLQQKIKAEASGITRSTRSRRISSEEEEEEEEECLPPVAKKEKRKLDESDGEVAPKKIKIELPSTSTSYEAASSSSNIRTSSRLRNQNAQGSKMKRLYEEDSDFEFGDTKEELTTVSSESEPEIKTFRSDESSEAVESDSSVVQQRKSQNKTPKKSRKKKRKSSNDEDAEENTARRSLRMRSSRSTRSRGTRTVRYNDGSGSEEEVGGGGGGGEEITSISSRGRIRKLSSKALEGKVY